jgi:hypothetical protein
MLSKICEGFGFAIFRSPLTHPLLTIQTALFNKNDPTDFWIKKHSKDNEILRY